MKYLFVMISLVLFGCASQQTQVQDYKRNRAYTSQPQKIVIPELGTQFLVIHPELLGEELQITEGLNQIFKDLFWAGLLSPLTQSQVQFQPTDRALILDIQPISATIRDEFRIRAFLPPQKLPQEAKDEFYLIIHEWSLGYGLTAAGFFDYEQSRVVSEPTQATTLSSVMSYSLWDASQAQVVQHGVVETHIPRTKSWTTEDFKELALKTNVELHRQLGGIQ